MGRSPFLVLFFLVYRGLGNWWIPKCIGPVCRLWFTLVGSFVESPVLQKGPAIEMIEMCLRFLLVI